ncbi:MAG: aminopeptidase P family N-terminal domain-containing protein, partial [Candidatus Omnitrophica bacterium]|nr:aminopeptidase P family N-terminal domain-containing protein [Candidatus Omnitrophota bacterium]
MNIQIKNLIIELNKLSCDSMLISNSESILCLTGINHTDGYIILGLNGEYTFFTSTLYEKAVKKSITSKVIIITGEVSTQIVKEIKRLKFKKVGFESKNLEYIKYKRLKEKINTTDITLVETSDLIKSLYIIKTKEQINLIKKSVEISTEAFEYIK